MTEAEYKAVEVLLMAEPDYGLTRLRNLEMGVCVVVARTADEAKALSDFYEGRKAADEAKRDERSLGA